jgi:hypothetical protein
MFQRAFSDDLDAFRNLDAGEHGTDRMEKIDDDIRMSHDSPVPLFGAHRS